MPLLWGKGIVVCNFSVDWSIEFYGLVGDKKKKKIKLKESVYKFLNNCVAWFW